ncbi:phosphomannomutase [Pseudohoeflea coraliihabitans]|uniref:Phosphomannomutase n=1 Tax=Pseudohoeflea coraliihabitans TaxID=2860393 RepID=A0ABS6WP01_9HYPH|nr:phosphomannomutase [Pseudohoeflea sp. DP4N28-3]MBW3097697.1 phosphomannomutase [Pseudohoeflea sp. DP4N28-3]
MAAKFGTSGLRGLVEELADGTAAVHVAAFVDHLKSSGQVATGERIYIGQDLRASSAEIAAQCMAAAEDEGMQPVDCGALPTPALAAFAMARRAAAIMVTGSHIPADRNGIKLYRPDGEIDKADEAAVAQGVEKRDRDRMRAAPRHKPPHEEDAALDAFAARFVGFIPDGALRGRRIGIYQHSTVGRDLFARILAPSGAEIIPLGRSDIFVPVDTEAVSAKTRERIHDWTQHHGLDALISADGDADRPLLADETGTCIRGDALGLIGARLVEADCIVTPVTSNSGIEAKTAARVMRTRVGSPHVIAGIETARAEGAARIVGFEANGGVLLGTAVNTGATRMDALPTRDCVFPVLAALSAARLAGGTLSALVEELALPVAFSGRIEHFATEKGQRLVAELTSDAAARAEFLAPFGREEARDSTDGLRLTLAGNRILHLRPSGNAPELRIYTEAESQSAAESLFHEAEERVRAWVQ